MGLTFTCTQPGPAPGEGHCSLLCTKVSACIAAEPVAESKGWRGEGRGVAAEPLGAPVWLSASHLPGWAPLPSSTKGRARGRRSPRCLSTVGFGGAMTAGCFRTDEPSTE